MCIKYIKSFECKILDFGMCRLLCWSFTPVKAVPGITESALLCACGNRPTFLSLGSRLWRHSQTHCVSYIGMVIAWGGVLCQKLIFALLIKRLPTFYVFVTGPYSDNEKNQSILYTLFQHLPSMYAIVKLDSWPLMMGPRGRPEMSLRNLSYPLCNSPEERSSLLLRGGSFKSRNYQQCMR